MRTIVIVVLVALAAAPPARAAEGFASHYQRGLALYRGGSYAGALEAFERAFALRPLPRLLLNVAAAERRLGRPAAALATYGRYLTLEPQPPEAIGAQVERAMAETRAQLAPPPAPAPRPTPLPSLSPPPRAAAMSLRRARPPAPRPARPLRRAWWLWTVVGVGVLAAGAAAAAIAVTRGGGAPEHNDVPVLRF